MAGHPDSYTAKTFLESLPIVKLEDLPENCDSCHICKELYDDPVPEVVVESPVKLPCNHIMGSECLAKWLDDNNTCPMCRTTFFAQETSNEERLRVRLENLMARTTRRANERQWGALSAAVADNNSRTRDLLALSEETNELFVRLGELQNAPDTEENRAEISRITDRNEEIDELLERLEEARVERTWSSRWTAR